MARSFLSYGLAICFVGVVLIMGFQFFRSDSSKMDAKKSIYASHRGNRQGNYAEHRSPSIDEIKYDDTMKPERDENGPITILKETVKETQQEPHEDPFFSIKKDSPISEEGSTTSTTTSSSEQQQQNKPNNDQDAVEDNSEDKLKISSTTTLENLSKPDEDEPKEEKESKDSSLKDDSSVVEPIIKKSNSDEATDDTLDKSNKDKSKDSSDDTLDESNKDNKPKDSSDDTLDESNKDKPKDSSDDTLDESTKKEKPSDSADDMATEERDVSKNYHSLKKINSKKSYYTTEDSLPVPIKRRKFNKLTQFPKKYSEGDADDTLDESKKLEKSSSSDDLVKEEEDDSSKSKYSLKKLDTKESGKSSEATDFAGSLNVSINDENEKKPNTKDDLIAQDK